MKILVTGGAGFIGKYLVDFLLEKNHFVTIFDNFSNSTKDSILEIQNKGVRVIEGDITNSVEVVDALKDHDLVIHLAAKISVSESIINPTDTFRVNVEGTKNILSACMKNHIKKLIVSSSAAVYGEGFQDVKLTESSETNPISPYGESKVKMEQEIRKFALEHEIDYVILRFFNIFGMGQSKEYAGVITKFMEKITQNKPIEIFGDGMQTRDFVSIYDVINSIYNAMVYDKSGIFNIASGKAVTIKGLAEKMTLFSGKKNIIKFLDARKGDIKHSEADISLAKKEMYYTPKFGLEKIKELFKK